MMAPTHMAAGALIGTAMCINGTYAPEETAAVLACAVLGSLFPDIDSVSSKLGRKLLAVSGPIQLVIGHRTMFHAPLLYGLLYGISLFFTQSGSLLSLLSLVACLSAMSHILLDSLNPGGVPFLWPYSHKYHLALFRVRGIVDILLFFVFAGLCLWLLWKSSLAATFQTWKDVWTAIQESWHFAN